MNIIEQVSRAIAAGCNLDPDAISPKAAKAGHSIPEWLFFTNAATKVIEIFRPGENFSTFDVENEAELDQLQAEAELGADRSNS